VNHTYDDGLTALMLVAGEQFKFKKEAVVYNMSLQKMDMRIV